MSVEAAKRLLSRAAHYREHGAIELSKSAALSAQAEATLALVEQQRVANLLRVQEGLSRNSNYELASELWVDQIKEVLGL